MTQHKLISVDEAERIAGELRATARRLVFTNGCFDLLHVGHVSYLEAARALGDALLVAINGDASVRALKGEGRPLNTAADRARVVAALETVTYVVIFEEVRATSLLRRVRPAIYVKGGDYSRESLNQEELAVLDDIAAEIRILPFERGYSTTRLIERMNAADA